MWKSVFEHADILAGIAALFASFQYGNWQMRSRPQVLISWSLVVFALLLFAGYVLIPNVMMTAQRAVSTLMFYVAGIYALACDALRFGLAAYLTRKRGEKWIKELDYIYLGLGALGLLGSINRLNFGSEHYTRADIVGPIVVATALVVRLIKTRAEIGGWNKL